MYNTDRTIAAISTPPGKGGVALIRMSGAKAIEIAACCFLPRSGRKVTDLPARQAVYGDILLEGAPIDDAVLTIFRAPHSYTGEDTVEICCHGGILLTHTVLSALFSAGAEQAEAGEFTRRAVLSGRLSLPEAEAIGCLLEAKSTAQLRLSAPGARSHLAEAIGRLHDSLLTLISSMYAKIDYPEEDLSDLSPTEILSSLDDILLRADRLLATYRTGRAVIEGIPTVLCGAPNVGKSALYNALCGEDLAIVTDYAGTTRDVLSTSVPLGRVMLRLFDTAGLRETDDPVEQIGVSRSRAHMEGAELLLAVFDNSRALQAEEEEWLHALRQSNQCVVILLNKCDLPAVLDPAVLADFPYVLPLSAKEGRGLEDLARLIDKLFTDEEIHLGEEAILASARQYAALCRMQEAVRRSRDAFATGLPADIASSDLEVALGAISELEGRTVHEEIIADIFRRFCVGK